MISATEGLEESQQQQQQLVTCEWVWGKEATQVSIESLRFLSDGW